jgi:hypothetical protein
MHNIGRVKDPRLDEFMAKMRKHVERGHSLGVRKIVFYANSLSRMDASVFQTVNQAGLRHFLEWPVIEGLELVHVATVRTEIDFATMEVAESVDKYFNRVLEALGVQKVGQYMPVGTAPNIRELATRTDSPVYSMVPFYFQSVMAMNPRVVLQP